MDYEKMSKKELAGIIEYQQTLLDNYWEVLEAQRAYIEELEKKIK